MKLLQSMVTGAVVLALVYFAYGQQDEPSLPGDSSTNTSADESKQVEASDVVPGLLIHQEDAQYPKEAKKDKIQGAVVLQATIGKDGGISNIAISSGDLVLADAAVDAVRDWKFEPYTKNGHAVQVRQNLTFNFAPGEKTAQFELQLPPATLATGSPTHPRREGLPMDVLAVGHGVTAPRAIYAPDPPYTEKARKAKYQGTCILSLIVGEDGRPREIQVDDALGMGLDQKAVEAVSGWNFEPATKDGEPVAVYVQVEVSFHLY